MSYTIEVYWGRQKAERHFGYFALYVSYFPQLVAGPIERPGHLLPQLRQGFDFDYGRVVEGLRLMVWGLFKKVVIADRLAMMVDNVYSQPGEYSGVGLSVATVFFAFQIYCDFSGYSDIAIGAAQVLGHRLMRNFDRPYFACSIVDFWKRWHISLSSWFRDYLYIPLGGSRVKVSRFYFNILVVFVVSGLWHGASWTFVVWGLLHGLLYWGEKATVGLREKAADVMGLAKVPRLHHAFRVVVTFGLVCFAWIFFRANSISDALLIVSRLGSGWGEMWGAGAFEGLLDSFGVPENEFWRGVAMIGVLVGVQFAHGDSQVSDLVAKWARPVRWVAYTAVVLLIFNLGVAKVVPFIYFQF